jgi:2'-5' RNA ligase
MSITIRTFIAIELPETITRAISEIQEGIKSYGFNIRWVRPENIHLTLKFLGDIKEDETDKIARVIFESVRTCSPISLSAKGIGVFPGIKRPRVIWVGVSGQINPLFKLQKKLEDGLKGLGFKKEKRAFRAHLTLGRIKDRIDSKRFGGTLRTFGGFESETFIADEIILYKSELKPTGAVYTQLVSVPFGELHPN